MFLVTFKALSPLAFKESPDAHGFFPKILSVWFRWCRGFVLWITFFKASVPKIYEDW